MEGGAKPRPIIGVLTVSDRASAGVYEDLSVRLGSHELCVLALSIGSLTPHVQPACPPPRVRPRCP